MHYVYGYIQNKNALSLFDLKLDVSMDLALDFLLLHGNDVFMSCVPFFNEELSALD